jgi:hypothetical protein
MPVIRIHTLPQPASVGITKVLGAVAGAAAEVFDVPAQQVWATWQTIGFDAYVEGDQAVDSQPRGTHPPIVEVLAYEGRSPELVARVLETIAGTLCEQLDLEAGSPFVMYRELRQGTVYTGGGVR